MKKKLNKSKMKDVLNKLRDLEDLDEGEVQEKPEQEQHPPRGKMKDLSKAKGEKPKHSALDRLKKILDDDDSNASVSAPVSNREVEETKEVDKEEEESDKEEATKGKKAKKHKKSSRPQFEREKLLAKKDELLEELKEEGELLEEEEDSEEEDGEGSNSGVGKNSKMAGKGERGVSRGQPPTPSLSIPALDSILKAMPKDRKEMDREVFSYLGKIKYLALRRTEKLLANPHIEIPPSELVKLSKELTDLQLTVRWTKKLERAILENPNKLNRPGQGGGWSLLKQLQTMSTNTKKENTRDGRDSGIKNAREALELPPDSSEKQEGVG